MKTINSPVARSENAILLTQRRLMASLDTAAIKREDRRKQRRSLRAELPRSVCEIMAEGFYPITIPVPAQVSGEVQLDEIPRKVAKLFSVPAGYGFDTPRVASVTVVRKRSFSRAQVETLQVAR